MTTVIDTIALILVIIGGLNWGSVGIFGVDLTASMFGGTHAVFTRIVYALIGIGALWTITLLFKEKVPADSYERERR